MINSFNKKCLKTQALNLLNKCSQDGDLEAKQLLIYLQHLRTKKNKSLIELEKGIEISLEKTIKQVNISSNKIKQGFKEKSNKRSKKLKNTNSKSKQLKGEVRE